MLKVAWSPTYRYKLPEGHRFPMEKYDVLPEQLIYEGTVSESAFFYPDKLQDEQLLLTHTSDYLQKLNLFKWILYIRIFVKQGIIKCLNEGLQCPYMGCINLQRVEQIVGIG